MGGEARTPRRAAAAAGSPDAGRSERPRKSLRETLLHAVDLCVAFITLADDDSVASAGTPVEPAHHPHRQPLRSQLGPRRSGAVMPREHACLTPVGRTTPARRSLRTRP